MTEQTRSGRAPSGGEVAAAALDRGKEQLDRAKSQLADGAERVAAAVDRTADGLEDEGDNAISGFGHSIASLMRQLSGGLRERDVEQFARELGGLARRNPGMFLAGSVALGFGIARFFKARPATTQRSIEWQGSAGWQGNQDSQQRSSMAPRDERAATDSEERLDLSEDPISRRSDGDSTQPRSAENGGSQQVGDANALKGEEI